MGGFASVWEKARIPICCSGAAFLYAQSFLLGQIEQSLGNSSVWNIVAPIVMMLFWRQLERPEVRRAATVSLAVAGGVGICLIIGGMLVCIGVALTFLSRAALLILWCDVYGRLPVEKTVSSFALMQLFALVLWGVAMLIPSEAYAGLCLAMPFASAAAMLTAHRAVGEMRLAPAPRKERLLFRSDLGWKFLIAAFVCAFAYGLNQMHSDTFHNVVAYGISGALLLAGMLLFSPRFSIHSILNMAFPLIIVGLVVSAAFGLTAPGMSALLVNVGYALMTALFTVLLADRSFRFGVSALWSAGIVRAALMAGVFLGSNVEHMLISFPQVQELMPQLLYGGTMASVAVAVVAWMQDADRGAFDAGVVGDPASSAGEVGVDGPQGFVEVSDRVGEEAGAVGEAKGDGIGTVKREIFRRCDELRDEFHLSGRELDVLRLLALGWSAPRIGEELVISNSTVKTHTRHIYRKLGVHSRDELKMLVGVDAF